MNFFLFVESLEEHFCNLTYSVQTNFAKHIENLPQHLLEKFISDNLSIINIDLRN